MNTQDNPSLTGLITDLAQNVTTGANRGKAVSGGAL